jgi:hypothetical protein
MDRFNITIVLGVIALCVAFSLFLGGAAIVCLALAGY